MAVIRWSVFICNVFSIRNIQGILLLLVLLQNPNLFVGSVPASCETVRQNFQTRGLPTTFFLQKPEVGTICGVESCCGKEEINLKHYNQMYLDNFVRDSTNKLASFIETKARKFDEFFRDMMNNSKHEFHEMFEKTYGKIYLQNSEVFSDFFNELETYYKKGTIKLSETMDNFFGILYQRMFTVINSQYVFDQKYLICVSEHMVDMKPFGDVPPKLRVQLRRSFVATRTFYKSLLVGANIATKLGGLRVDEACANELTRMQQCGACAGNMEDGVACADYCTNTLENCLEHHVKFGANWDKYIEALDKVADRLLGPFNIEMVVDPLNIKISEAIMNFQENGQEVSQKIYTLCGKPSLSRRRRKAEYPGVSKVNRNLEIKYEPAIPDLKKRRKNKKKLDEIASTPTLEKIISEIKAKVRETRQYWSHLPYDYCNNASIAAVPSKNGQCWNGNTIGAFIKSPPKAPRDSNPLVDEINLQLQVYSDKLRKAYQGEEVEIVDEEEDLQGSGSGSGDGSSDIPEDDEDFNVPNPGPEVDRTEPEVAKPVNTDSDINVEVEASSTTSTQAPEVRVVTGGVSDTGMSVERALVQYLVPIVLVWFGGTFADVL